MIKMIGLLYPMNALEPYYTMETLDLHYNVLYKGYVDSFNKTEDKLKDVREKDDYSNIKCLEKNLSFFGSGAILHELFFTNLGPAIPTSPSVELMNQIIKDFGSFEKFKRQFSEAASQVEASGWCLLVWTNRLDRLNILQCEKHQNLTLWGCKPILVIDMWEHSYYLQYKTKRPEYIDAFWNIVNWNEANKRFNKIKNDK
ncbi:MAG TPA: superoxide dismutase [Clostridiales bacterium]|nr:superoxide dismutase [Clostridiales bacterium]